MLQFTECYSVLMIRPSYFGFNAQTASTNAFQHKSATDSPREIHRRAVNEFDEFVERLKKNKVDVIVVEDTSSPVKPDAIFPNNWVSFHEDGAALLYPMYAPNRRQERRADILRRLESEYGRVILRTIDFSSYESADMFLEGTGSLVLDYSNRIAYACVSPRTHPFLLGMFAGKMKYEMQMFHAFDQGQPIYHTNVVMALGTNFAILCCEAISDRQERQRITGKLESTGHELIEISLEQLRNFAGNMLEIQNTQGEKILVMSSQAKESLAPDQIKRLEQHCILLDTPLYTIEKYGGGSARCMLAEILLPST